MVLSVQGLMEEKGMKRHRDTGQAGQSPIGPSPIGQSPAGWCRRVCALAVVFLGVCLGLAVPGAVHADTAGALTGYWLSQDHDGVFRIEQCGQTVCGRLVGLRYDGTDVPHGHDGKSECGITMLTGFVPLGDSQGRLGGNILDPDTGHVYDAQIWSPRPDVLKLRGYLGLPIFGETQTWTRYTGPPMGPMCKMP
ncbi:MAG: DUF2147 domain-containing protein [Acetobacter sp.]